MHKNIFTPSVLYNRVFNITQMGHQKSTQNLHHKNYLHLRTTEILYDHINLRKLAQQHVTTNLIK